jgi:putative ABC transport system ATP-binding protein
MRDRALTRFRLLHIGFVFQRFYLMPALTAADNVALPMAEAGVPKQERRTRALELLRYVGLDSRARHRPSQLSGGEQQRVAIARAMANAPAVVLADELTGELDARTGAEIIALLQRLNADGTALVLVTHDEQLARAARRVVHMRDGVIVTCDGSR